MKVLDWGYAFPCDNMSKEMQRKIWGPTMSDSEKDEFMSAAGKFMDASIFEPFLDAPVGLLISSLESLYVHFCNDKPLHIDTTKWWLETKTAALAA